jgi:hypothetical protein
MDDNSFSRHADLPRVEESSKYDLSSAPTFRGLTLLAAILTSAPGRTSAGDLPPNSMTDGLPISFVNEKLDENVLEMLSTKSRELTS